MPFKSKLHLNNAIVPVYFTKNVNAIFVIVIIASFYNFSNMMMARKMNAKAVRIPV